MRPREYWTCQLGGWGLYAVATFVQMWPVVAHVHAVLEPIVVAALGIALTHAYRGFVRGRDWRHLEGRALLGRVAGASLVLPVIFVAIVGALEIVVFDVPFSWLGLTLAWVRWAIVFFVWSVLYFGAAIQIEGRLLRERHDKAIKIAELSALKAQLNPHFLFNSLNSVRALIADAPERAQDAVTQLATTLRYSLTAIQEEVVTIDRELKMVDDYLELEGLRLGDRLRVEREFSEAARRARIPVMLLQTVVENAVKHGLARLRDGGTLRIAARIDAGQILVIEVDNPYPETADPHDDGRPKIGLANALERLQLLFGPDATLVLDRSDRSDRSGPRIARVRVRVPQDQATR